MATKTVHLPTYSSLTGMFAFLYVPSTGALINSGGDALTLKAGSDSSAGLFEFDVAESLSAYDWVKVDVHSSATRSPSNLLWIGSLVKLESECQDFCPPVANHYATELAGLIAAVVGAGAISNANSATETFMFTYKGKTYTVAQTNVDATGNRATPTVGVT